MDESLILLIRKGAHISPIRMTTTEFGAGLGMSQQNASRKLSMLEQYEYIERTSAGIKLTEKACTELSKLYSDLRSVFEGGKIEFDGVVVRGLGEGRYYLSMPGYRRQIKEKLGFDVYPGTLNVKISDEQSWKKKLLMKKDPIIISGFTDKKRTYGDLFAFKCTLENSSLPCVVIMPLRTHHGPEIIEVISDRYLKRALKKKDGNSVKVVA